MAKDNCIIAMVICCILGIALSFSVLFYGCAPAMPEKGNPMTLGKTVPAPHGYIEMKKRESL